MAMETLGTHGNTRHAGHRTDINPPLPKGASHAVQHPTGRGGGHSRGLKGHRDRTGGLQGGAQKTLLGRSKLQGAFAKSEF